MRSSLFDFEWVSNISTVGATQQVQATKTTQQHVELEGERQATNQDRQDLSIKRTEEDMETRG